MGKRRSSTTILVHEAVSGGGMVDRDLPACWLAEGTAIRRVIVADFAAVPGVRVVETIDGRCVAGSSGPANVTRIIADPARPLDFPMLLGVADAVIIVAPESGGVLLALARQVEHLGGRSLGSDPGAIALCGDKFRMAEHFARVGIPTPPSRRFVPADGLPAIETPTGRVVVKPLDGAGAVDTFILDAASLCPPGLRARPLALIQPFYPGQPSSASFLVRNGRATLLAVGAQRIEVDPLGQVRYAGGAVPVPLASEDLAPVRAAVELVPGLAGFVGVDFLHDQDGPYRVQVLEINPRPTTSLVGLTRLAPAGTIAAAWLRQFEPHNGFDLGEEVGMIATARPVRFGVDGVLADNPEAAP